MLLTLCLPFLSVVLSVLLLLSHTFPSTKLITPSLRRGVPLYMSSQRHITLCLPMLVHSSDASTHLSLVSYCIVKFFQLLIIIAEASFYFFSPKLFNFCLPCFWAICSKMITHILLSCYLMPSPTRPPHRWHNSHHNLSNQKQVSDALLCTLRTCTTYCYVYPEGKTCWCLQFTHLSPCLFTLRTSY